MRNSGRQKGHHFFPHFSLFIMKISERHTERERERERERKQKKKDALRHEE